MPQVKLFSSAKEASADRPQKSLLFRLAGLPPEEVTFLASSGIRQLAPGGKARAFADIVGDRLGQSEQRQFSNLAQTLVPYATGDSLDLLGEIYGVARIGQSSVVADLSDQNFEFYVRRGTFGDINNGNDIEIPQDTRIFTGDPNGPVYLADAMTLAAGDSQAFFSARSLLDGSAGNAPSGVFDRHNFTHYADSRFGTLLVTNSFGLVGGRETETDDDYRFRLNLKIQSAAGANEAALRFELLQIPGIQDLVFERQAGAFIVYVYGISPNVSPGLLQNVQNAINDKAAYPLTGLAVAPDLVGISLATTMEFKTGTSVDEKNLALEAAAAAVENCVPRVRMTVSGGSFNQVSLHTNSKTALLTTCNSAVGGAPGTPAEPLRMRRWAGSAGAQGRGPKGAETSRSSGLGDFGAKCEPRVRSTGKSASKGVRTAVAALGSGLRGRVGG